MHLLYCKVLETKTATKWHLLWAYRSHSWWIKCTDTFPDQPTPMGLLLAPFDLKGPLQSMNLNYSSQGSHLIFQFIIHGLLQVKRICSTMGITDEGEKCDEGWRGEGGVSTQSRGSWNNAKLQQNNLFIVMLNQLHCTVHKKRWYCNFFVCFDRFSNKTILWHINNLMANIIIQFRHQSDINISIYIESI